MGKSRAHNILQAKSEKVFSCSMCRYMSNRLFNITRHERRIHMAPRRLPQCCDTTFETKGQYYQHCEEIHPGKRNNLMSQIKYGIGTGSVFDDPIKDINTSQCNYQEYPQTRYMLRPRVNTKFAKNSFNENSDIDDYSMKSTEKYSKYKIDESSSMNLNSSFSEPSDDDDMSELAYSSNDEPNNNEKTEKKSSEDDDSYSDDQGSSSDDNSNDEGSSSEENSEKKKNVTKSDGASVSMIEQGIDQENINFDPSIESSKTIFSSSENDSVPLSNNALSFVERKRAICDETGESKNGLDLNIPITFTPSTLPLKKRILQNLALQNRENIENSRKPMGDRLYQTPMKVEWKIEHVSKKYRNSKETRLTLRKTMTASQSCSISNDTENVSPRVPFSHGDETFKVEFRKNVESSWQQVTKHHRDYLSSTGFWSLNFFNDRRRI